MCERKFTMGQTAITCRGCKTPAFVDNLSLEAMTEYGCPNCGKRMTDRELARLKMHYYYLVTEGYNNGPFGPIREFFDYDILLDPHFEENAETTNQ